MPLVRRLPKRGFTNIFRKEFVIVNVGQLERFPAGAEITPDLLLAEGVVSQLRDGVKILGDGDAVPEARGAGPTSSPRRPRR